MRAAARTVPLVAASGLLLVAPLALGQPAVRDWRAPPSPPLVLHVGDSFVGSGLAPALKPKFEALGARYISIAHTSAYTTTLMRQTKFDSLIRVQRPVLVIVTIGANEMRMPLPEQHAHAVKALAKAASQTTCVWALPPRWDDKETGILAIMKRDAGPCRVHDPSAIEKTLPRGSDKIHPNGKGGVIWADALFKWLMEGLKDGEVPWGDPPPAIDPKEQKKG